MSLSRRGLLGLALAMPVGAAHAAPFPQLPLIMATGRAGTPYARYGAAWGSLAQMAGLNIAFHASNGAVSNILLIERNAAQLGMTTAMVGAEARQGQGQWTAGVELDAFRVLFPALSPRLCRSSSSPRRTGITSITQLAGKRIRPERPRRYRHRRRAEDPRHPWHLRRLRHHRHISEQPGTDDGRATRCLRLHQRATARVHVVTAATSTRN